MLVSELDIFFQKFKQPWNTGHVAHLDVFNCAGNAWVGLRLVGPPFTPFGIKVESPSRLRLRCRCAAQQYEKPREEARKEKDTEKDSIANEERVILKR